MLKDIKKNLETTDYELLKENINSKKISDTDMFYLQYDILSRLKSGEKFADILQDIKKDKYSWSTKDNYDLNNKRELYNQQLKTPSKMNDGVAKCPKCSKKKTVIVEFQGRSCDEGFTYELHCYNDDCSLVKTRNFEME